MMNHIVESCPLTNLLMMTFYNCILPVTWLRVVAIKAKQIPQISNKFCKTI